MANEYITEADFRAFVKDGSALNQAAILTAITTASRTIDQMCNRPAGAFLPTSSAVAHYFGVKDYTRCPLVADDLYWEFSTTTGLVVKIDQDGDGTYETTLTNGTHFFLEPINGARYGISGYPYDELRVLVNGGLTFPRSLHGYRPPVEVTAKWGWAATPDQVTFACRLAANRLYGRGDARYGTAGFDASGFSMRIRTDPDIQSLLQPLIPASRMVA